MSVALGHMWGQLGMLWSKVLRVMVKSYVLPWTSQPAKDLLCQKDRGTWLRSYDQHFALSPSTLLTAQSVT